MGRRTLLLAPLLAAIFLGALVRFAGDDAGGNTRLEYAVTPTPSSLSIGIAHTARGSTMQAALDRCDGPVAVQIRNLRPTLLAEHDYCGGRWILRLRPGDVIDLAGGRLGGTYRVNEAIKVVHKGTSSAVIRGMGDVVAQTCRRDGRTLRLVGLTRLD